MRRRHRCGVRGRGGGGGRAIRGRAVVQVSGQAHSARFKRPTGFFGAGAANARRTTGFVRPLGPRGQQVQHQHLGRHEARGH